MVGVVSRPCDGGGPLGAGKWALQAIVSIPIRDLPDSETALARLATHESLKVRECVHAAENVRIELTHPN